MSQIIFPSPQAAALARYGEYPVGHSSGVPNISIPLYEIKLGDYKLPISISYHASGIKQDDVASVVGLGWVLNAGGVISRTIQGAPDLKYGFPSVYDTLYYSYDRIKDLVDGAYESGLGIGDLITMTTDKLNSDYDTESDRYSFNFGGKSGIFRYSREDKAFIPFNHYPIYIHASCQPNDKSSFYIVDSDGIVYNFNDCEYTGLKDEEGTTDITSWYLSEINTPNGNITFSYIPAETYEMYTYSETLKAGLFFHTIYEDYYGFKHSRSRAKQIYQTILLSQITWKGHKIKFTYGTDREDIYSHRLAKMEVIDNQDNVAKQILFDNDKYLGEGYTLRKRMMLNSMMVSDEGKYIFNYNTNNIFPEYRTDSTTSTATCSIDYWGYYNGTSSPYFIPKEILPTSEEYKDYQGLYYQINNGAIRTPNFSYGSTAILTSITYPTGGHTNFLFEQNRVNDNVLVGGLRIKEISSYDRNGTLLTRKKYEYQGYRTYDLPKTAMTYYTYHYYYLGNGDGFFSRYYTCVSNPLVPLSDNSGSPIFYTEIKESFNDSSYIKYHYMNGCKYDLRGTTDECHPSLSLSARLDEGNYPPLLCRKEYYDSLSVLYKSETNDYEIKELKEIELGTKLIQLITYTLLGEPRPITSMMSREPYIQYRPVIGHVKSCLLKSKTITDHITGFSTTETYTYDNELRTLKPQTISRTDSNGKTYLTDYEYTFERNDDVCQRMADYYFIVDPVITKKEYCDGELMFTSQTLFKYLSPNDWFYPEFIYESTLNNPLEKKVHYLDYDEQGNLLSLTTNKRDTTTLIWGYEGNYPVAKIEGCSYASLRNNQGVDSILSTIGNCTNNTTMNTYLQELRNSLGNQYPITTYLYKPLFGVNSITDQRGYTKYFDYHNNGKLSRIRDYRGFLQSFEYNYVNPFNP